MAITVKYKILFSLDVLHHYFLDQGERHYESLNTTAKLRQLQDYNVHDVIDIVPTVACRQVIKDAQLIFKKTTTGILIASKIATDPQQPFMSLPADTAFTFYIHLKQQDFFNFTSLPMDRGSQKPYYFSNLDRSAGATLNLSSPAPTFSLGANYSAGTLVLNADGTGLSLLNRNTTQATNGDLLKDVPAAAYDNSQVYEKGDIVSFATGNMEQLFEAKIDNPADTPNDEPANDWQKQADLPLNYINDNDLLNRLPSIYNYALADEDVQATATLMRKTPKGFMQQQQYVIRQSKVYAFDWRRLSSGVYRLVVSDDQLAANAPNKTISEDTFYLHNEVLGTLPFGIVELYASRADGDPFAPFAADGSLATKSPRYVIRLKNRLTRWRYRFWVSQAVAASDDVAVDGVDSSVLVTKKLHPLTQNGLVTIKQGTKNLPNPDSKTIRPSADTIYSDIHL